MSFNSDHSDFDDEDSKWDYFRKLKQLDHDQVDENDERLRNYIHNIDETQSSVLSDEMNAMERALKLGSLRDQISDNIVQKIDDPKDRMLVGLLYKVCNDIDPTRMQFIKFSILLYEHGILSNLHFLLDDNDHEEEFNDEDANINNLDVDLNENDGWSDTWSDDEDLNNENNTPTNTDSNTQFEDTSMTKQEDDDIEAMPAVVSSTIMSFKSFEPLINAMNDREEEKTNANNNNNNISMLSLTKSSSSSIRMNPIQSRYHREFEEIECIGFGAFGTVYKVKHHLDSAIYAIKKIVYKHDAHNHEQVKSEIVREVSNMAQLNHDNIVRYYTSWIEPVITTNNNNNNNNNNTRNTDYLKPSGSIPIIRKTPSNEELSVLLSSQANKSLMTPYASPQPPNRRWTDNIYNYWQNKMSYSCLFLQSEYCGDYTLKDFINEGHRTPERDDNMHIFAQILLGLAHCHNNKIVHRDLKPENVFLMSSNHEDIQHLKAKIGDFGLSKSLMTDTNLVHDPAKTMRNNLTSLTTGTGTQTYAAPEQLTGEIYDVSADIYALGIILFELIQAPFDTQMERMLAINRFRKLHEIDAVRIDEVKFAKEIEIMMKMTAHNPRKRPSAHSLILDQFIQIYWMTNVLNGAIPVSIAAAARQQSALKSAQPQRSLEYFENEHNENDIRVSVVESKADSRNNCNIADSPTFLISSPSTPPNTLALDADGNNNTRNLLQVMTPLSINQPLE